MKKIILSAILLIFVGFFLQNLSSISEESKDGKTLFIEKKCNMCHPIAKLEIEAKMKNQKEPAPDLGAIDFTGKEDFVKQYLLKNEVLNDKKHPIKFSGSEEELGALVGWLVEINKPVEEKK